MEKEYLYLLLNISLLLAACSGGTHATDSPSPQPNSRPIAFASFDNASSRTSSPLSSQIDNFMVWAQKEGVLMQTQLVFPNYLVKYRASGWYYEGIGDQTLKFWDESADSYTFAAVAPAPDNSPEATVGYRNTTVDIADGHISINNIIGNISTGKYTNSLNAPQWMVATTRRDKAPLASTDVIDPAVDLHAASPLTAFSDQVPLYFHPLMARVDFYLFSTPGALLLQTFVVETEDGQKIINRGDYDTKTGWTKRIDEDDLPLNFGAYHYADGRVISTDKLAPTLMASHTQIPQSWAAEGRRFKITCETKDGDIYQGHILLNAETNTTCSWEAGTHYIYTLRIYTESASNEIILFDVETDTWTWQEGHNIEDTETNW